MVVLGSRGGSGIFAGVTWIEISGWEKPTYFEDKFAHGVRKSGLAGKENVKITFEHTRVDWNDDRFS